MRALQWVPLVLLAGCMTPQEPSPEVAVVVGAAEDVVVSRARPVHAQTPLGVALRQALLQGPFLNAAQAAEAAQMAAVTEARAAWRPSLSAGVDAGIGTDSDPSLVPVLRLSQRIFDGGVSENRIAAAEVRGIKARAETRMRLGERALSAIRAWEELHLARQLLVIARDDDRRLERIAAQTDMRVQAGAGRNADRLRVSSRRAEVAATLASAQGRVREAEARVQELFAGAPADGSIPVAPSTSRDVTNNPMMIALRAEERAVRREMQSVQAGRFPSVFLDVTARAPQDADAAVGAGLRLGYEFGTDGRQSAALARAEAVIAQAVADRELAEQDLQRALTTARGRQTTLAAELAAARRAAETSQAALADAEAQFSSGRVDILDLLELGRDVNRTAARAAEIASEARIAGFVVLYLTGELLDVFGLCVEGCRT